MCFQNERIILHTPIGGIKEINQAPELWNSVKIKSVCMS